MGNGDCDERRCSVNLNQIIIIGNLGKDPEPKTTKNGNLLVNFSVATTDGWGENKHTNWHNVTVFGKTAEFCEKYLQKGSKVAVVGSVDYQKWEKDGETKYMTKIIGDKVKFLSPKSEEATQKATSKDVWGEDDLPNF